ncbi:MAG: hypothetical protein WB816_02055 [Methylocystis sp.]
MGERATTPFFWPRGCALVCGALLLGGCLDTAVDLGARQASAPARAGSFAARPGVSPRGASLAFSSIEGPPDALGARFMQRFTQAAQARDIALATPETAQYRLRAYLTASPAQGATRLAYVLDVFDRQGRRVQRLTDEAGVGPASEPWEAVDDRALALFADRGAEEIAAFLSNTPEAIAAAGGEAGVSVAVAQHAHAADAARPSGVAQLR